MAPNDAFKRQALRAYERGRIRLALRLAYVAVPAACLGLSLGAPLGEVACMSMLVLGLGTFLRWRGRDGGPAVLPGVVGGLIPAVGVGVAMLAGWQCQSLNACAAMILFCGVGGGAVVARFAVRDAVRRPVSSLLAGSLMAGLTTCVSCAALGYKASLFAVTGVLVGGILFSVLWRTSARRMV